MNLTDRVTGKQRRTDIHHSHTASPSASLLFPGVSLPISLSASSVPTHSTPIPQVPSQDTTVPSGNRNQQSNIWCCERPVVTSLAITPLGMEVKGEAQVPLPQGKPRNMRFSWERPWTFLLLGTLGPLMASQAPWTSSEALVRPPLSRRRDVGLLVSLTPNGRMAL